MGKNKCMAGTHQSGATRSGEPPPNKNISDVTDESLIKNIKIVIAHFKEKFNMAPTHVIRVPGRVNLIGEHIDYCGFPVCPMALDKAVFLAVAADPSANFFVQASNVDSEKYKFSGIHEYKEKLDISLSGQGWLSYIACGIQGVIDKNVELKLFEKPQKMLIAVHSNLPASAGLSSSSALVCAGFLATCVINNVVLSKTEMATLCAEAEYYIGTRGGGMDQAIAFNGEKGRAKLVKFNPLKLSDIILPQGAVLMIANSLVEKNKAMSNEFNTRVVECRLACFMIAKQANVANWKELKRLADVRTALDHLSLSEMQILVEKVFHAEPYTKEEICQKLEVKPEELNDLALTPDTYNLNYFKLKQRAAHVYEEAERVYTWRNWCAAGKSLTELGTLMSRSHFSLQWSYECSHPDLDKLVSIFMMSGAYGARLTGAGWGGCVVALVSSDKIDNIMSSLYDLYYKKIFKMKDEMSTAVFIVTPGDGAEIFNI